MDLVEEVQTVKEDCQNLKFETEEEEHKVVELKKMHLRHDK